MTAFAAIVARDPASQPNGAAEVAAALSAVYRTSCKTIGLDGCVLLAAPIVSACPDLIFARTEAGIVATGQVLFEDRHGLTTALSVPSETPSLALGAEACSRWGDSCTDRLSGEFSLAMWNERQRTLVCARDGLGLRPLFVATGADVLLVTNMLSAARAHPSVSHDLDEPSLAVFLATGGLPESQTPYRAIVPVPAGHTLTIAADHGPILRRHWWFPATDGPPIRDTRLAVEGYRSVLQQAVSDRLAPRTSILMSAGIDSTTIAAAAKAVAPTVDLRAFTADYRRVPAASELPRATVAAAALGIPIVGVPGDDYPALDHLTNGPHTPQPLDEPAMTDWRALIGAAAEHSHVALYGEDGDSLFLPPAWRPLQRATPLATLALDVSQFVARTHRLPYVGLRLRERVGVRHPPAPPPAPRWLSAKALRLRDAHEPSQLLGQPTVPLPPHATRPEVQQRLSGGVASYLSGILTPEVTSHRLELRCPLLDTRVVRFVMNVASIPWCQHKHLPRRAYAGVLPPSILSAPKRGVAGLDAALARDWQRQHAALASSFVLPESLNELVVTEDWRRDLLSSDERHVGKAWRVLELGAWLSGVTSSATAQERRV